MLSSHVDIHTHHTESGPVRIATLMLGEKGKSPTPPRSAGIHPWSLEHLTDAETEAALATLESIPDIAAIGEIGLDYAREIPHERQKSIFARQLAVAAKRDLPVILHTVRAWDDTLALLSRHRLPAAIFHGFTGSEQQARQILKSNPAYYLSFGERAFRSPKTVEALRQTPLSRLFLETDNGDMPIEAVYTETARILGIPLDELRDTLYNNYKTLFA